jgi:polyphosphate kinase
MDRNLSRRVEVVWPVEQPDLKQRLIDEVLATSLVDNVKARVLLPDGTYRRVERKTDEPAVRSQERFLELAAAAAARRQLSADALTMPPVPLPPEIPPRPMRKKRRHRQTG